MDAELTRDHSDLAALCREILTERFPSSRLHELVDAGTPHDPLLWRTLADAGLLGLAFGEDVGGAGAGLVELGIAFREVGRALVPTTLSSSVLAAIVVDRLGSAEQRAAHVGAFVRGELLATVASGAPGFTAAVDGEGWLVRGAVEFVPDASSAGLIVVKAEGPSGTVFLLVPAGTPGLRTEPHTTMGGDVLDRVVLDGVELPRSALLPGPEPLVTYHRCLDTAVALQAMEMLGGAEAVTERTAAYVSQREQFGRPIGSFQAVQHIVADRVIAITGGEVVALRALWLLDNGRDARTAAAAAASWLGRTFVDATLWAHQVHGGMGFARETDLHLWSQRARLLEAGLGGARGRLRTIADDLLGPVPA